MDLAKHDYNEEQKLLKAIDYHRARLSQLAKDSDEYRQEEIALEESNQQLREFYQRKKTRRKEKKITDAQKKRLQEIGNLTKSVFQKMTQSGMSFSERIESVFQENIIVSRLK